MEIKSTKDYGIFKSAIQNREVFPKHVKAIADSIKIRNLLHIRPMHVNEEMVVIDGQHRLAAAELLDIEIYYMVCPGLLKSDLAVLNSNQKNWTQVDFINFYTLEGHPEFKKLSRLMNQYSQFNASVIMRLACNGQRANHIRAGVLIVNTEARAIKVLDLVLKIRDCVKTNPNSFQYLYSTRFVTAVKSYDLSEFQITQIFSRIKENKRLVYPCVTEHEYKNMIKGFLTIGGLTGKIDPVNN